MNKKICVFGSYKNLNKKYKDDVVKLGTALAKNGFDIISGGFGGTMEDISKGAKLAGGRAIGVTYYKWEDAGYKGPNKFIDEEIKAANIFERISIMMDKSDGFIVLNGGTGTLLELSACLECVNKGLMRPKPIIALGSFWEGVINRLSDEKVLSEKARSLLNALSCKDLVKIADTVEEAIEILVDSLKV